MCVCVRVCVCVCVWIYMNMGVYLERELMFADNTDFVARNHQDAQEIITRFSKSAKANGLKINLKKSEVMNQPSPGSHDIWSRYTDSGSGTNPRKQI